MAAPSNQTAPTAIAITTLPSTISQRVDDAGTTYTVWYKYTATFTGELGLWGFGDFSTYQPTLKVYLGPDTSPVAYLTINANAAAEKPYNFPVTNGTTYWFEFVTNGGNPSPANLEIRAEAAPDTSAVAGQIMMTDYVDGFAAIIMPRANGQNHTTLKYVVPFYAARNFDIIPSGRILTENVPASTDFGLYNPDFTLNKDFTWSHVGTGPIRANANQSKWYMGAPGGGASSPPAKVVPVDSDGNLGTELTGFTLSGMDALASSNDDTTLYYAGNYGLSGDSTIKRWTIGTDSAASDFVADFGGGGLYRITSLLVLSDGKVVAAYQRLGVDSFIKIYNTDGTTFRTFSHTALGLVAGDVINVTREPNNDPNSFWMQGGDSSDSNGHIYTFKELNVNGTIMSSNLQVRYDNGVYLPAATPTPLARFGPTCFDFVILTDNNGSGGGSNPSVTKGGLYQLVPNRTHDTLWKNFPSTTFNRKIP